MPGDSKKDKKKNDPKEQRKPRQSRNQKNDEKSEVSKPAPKVPQKPVYQDPGPEFYKSLKRETDEIVKITEEENSKYKKKEIQSNWAKYEMPIESYDDAEEQDAGADYEKLIQAPLSVGGYFQFKHEKSWEATTGPSEYDKYFDINMQHLYVAISTIPFYERNNLSKSLFSDTDMLNMNNRANKYKHKYYNDKKYATPETEMQEKICNSLRESLSETLERKDVNECTDNVEFLGDFNATLDIETNASLNIENDKTNDDVPLEIKEIKQIDIPLESKEKTQIDNIDDIIVKQSQNEDVIKDIPSPIVTENIEKLNVNMEPKENKPNDKSIQPPVLTDSKRVEPTATVKTNPVIESPEDLEKWLDDFLDG